MRDLKEIIDLVKSRQTLPSWVLQARNKNAELNALVYGRGFHELLINKIEKIESADRQAARKKYSIDVRDLFYRIMEPRNNVFSSDGGSENIELNESVKKELKERLTNFKGGKSIDSYLSQYLFTYSDVDPNGIIFLEYVQQNGELKKLYPTYKSIQKIQDYESDGLRLDWVLFSPVEKRTEGKIIKSWRYVDELLDVNVTQIGSDYFINEEDVTKNDFEQVPAVLLSDTEKAGSQERLSWLFFIEELSKKYARDRSIKTLYEFLQGFPKHWRYDMQDNDRLRLQRDGQTSKGKSEDNKELRKPDVTDEIVLEKPTDKELDPIIAPNIAGYISPDLDTLKHMEETGMSLEKLIEYTMWGTTKITRDVSSAKTATEVFADNQPINNKLHVFSDYAESVHNLLVGYALKLINRGDLKGDSYYYKSYGRRFIIESPDVLLDKYNSARKIGASVSILDKLLNELVSSKYKNDPKIRAVELKKIDVEPYVHLSVEQVNTIFGAKEALKKAKFSEYWSEEADIKKEAKQIREDFITWFNQLEQVTQLNNNNNEQE